MRRIRTILLLLGLMVLVMPPAQALRHTAARFEACPEIVREALVTTGNLCQEIGRNQACYGHAILQARSQPSVTLLKFDQEGDIADLNDLQSIRLSKMDTMSGAWGIGLMSLQATKNLPDKNITMLLFGDVEIDNRMTVAPSIETTVGAARSAKLYQFPSQDATVIARLAPGEAVTANGRLSDNSWIRISEPEAGWVKRTQLTSATGLRSLSIVEASSRSYGPMQAFYFRSGQNDSICAEAPDSGILIQTPEGVAEVSLLINEVDIQLGSTVYFQAESSGDMIIRVVEGSAQASAFDTTFKATAGMQISVPLDEDLKPSGPPTEPRAYDLADVRALPLGLLERSVSIHPPVEPEETGTVSPSEEAVEEIPEEPGSTVVPPTVSTPGNPSAVPPTSVRPTSVIPTSVLPTSVPPTDVPPTSVIPTSVLPTSVPPTVVPPTNVPPTSVPPTPIPPTAVPPTAVPTDIPPTDIPPTAQKIVICHNGNTIEIDPSALDAHLAHGDTIGPCPQPTG